MHIQWKSLRNSVSKYACLYILLCFERIKSPIAAIMSCVFYIQNDIMVLTWHRPQTFFVPLLLSCGKKKCQEWDHEDATMVIYAFDNGILTLQNCFFHFTHYYNASYCSTADCCADCSSPSLSAERTSKISVIIGTPRKEAGMDVPCICSLESRRSTTPKCKIHLKGKENSEFFLSFFFLFLLRSCENM